MATATEPNQAEEIPEPIPDRNDVQKIIRTVALDKIAHTGIMLDRMNRNLRAAERIQQFTVTGDINDLKAPEGEDDMGVNIGNEYHFHNQETQPTAVAGPTTPPPQPPPPPVTTDPIKPEVIRPEIVKPEVVQPVIVPPANGRTSVLPAVLSTVLGVVGAGGIGLGALALWNSYNDKPTVNVSDEDRDWRIGLRVQDHP